ncbi:MAG: glycosyltransferase family 2 protein [Lachnospiraceae bacterium]|jgi:rhamnosyltransferase|nr:glycosyltransferase family 2 protein [Lachnospiraceae bacterium]
MEAISNWKNYSVDVFIPTYHSDEKLERLLTMLYRQTIKPNRVIILHTVEQEGQEQPLPTIPDSNISVIPIPKSSFDHGGTRKYGATLSDADILLFMTQDAVPADEYLIENLLKPYENPRVSAAYARQLANDSSDIIEEFTRKFNYPKKSFVKSKADLDAMGIKTYFCSNVCASYRNDIYKELGGFVKKTIFNEDMIMAAGMIEAGYRIAYSAEAKVIHSHRYSYLQQFTRNFDLGVSHNQYSDIFRKVKSESEGIKLVKKTLRFLVDKKEFLLIPDLILTSGFKYLGYQMGLHYDILPEKFVLHCSMNKSYWRKENL